MRPSLRDLNFFGVDSVQGLLELAEWYGEGHVAMSFNPDDSGKQVIDLLNQLDQDGYVRVVWETMPEGALRLASATLTIKGHEHLYLLRERGGLRRVRKRLVDIAWMVLTSIVTTLVILQAKGCTGR
jgi:hypothetical protein